jgi:O-antigen/teichoic acid export membrane protein
VEGRADAYRGWTQCGKNFLSNFITFVVERGARLWYCCAAFSYLRETPISISPNALLTVFALLAALTLGIGIGFAALGACRGDRPGHRLRRGGAARGAAIRED